MCALIFVFVGQFLDDGKNILLEKAAVVGYAVVGVEQVQFDALEGDGFVGIDKKCHVAAAGDPVLDQFDQFCQKFCGVAFVFFEENVVGVLIEFGGGDEGLQVFFDDQAIGDGVGFDFLIAEFIPKEGNEKFVLEGEFAHGLDYLYFACDDIVD